ncbi:DUF1127 domain-containing protein [Agarivorans sp.]|uniref:DUF1127 domain-containing protein n=1 Tax=Agarivorans sp. TaxID=1872412 RepID=UPI003D03531D
MLIASQVATVITRLHAKVAEYRALSRSRRALRYLSDATLRDIGVTRQQAMAQASLPFWRKSQPVQKAVKAKPKAKQSQTLEVSK